MRKLSLCLAVSLFVSVWSFGAIGAPGSWDKGENRISDSDFESSSAEDLLMDWTIEKSG